MGGLVSISVPRPRQESRELESLFMWLHIADLACRWPAKSPPQTFFVYGVFLTISEEGLVTYQMGETGRYEGLPRLRPPEARLGGPEFAARAVGIFGPRIVGALRADPEACPPVSVEDMGGAKFVCVGGVRLADFVRKNADRHPWLAPVLAEVSGGAP